MNSDRDKKTGHGAPRDLEDLLDQWQTPQTPPWLAARSVVRMAKSETNPAIRFRRPVLAMSLAASLALGSIAGWLTPLPPETTTEDVEFTW